MSRIYRERGLPPRKALEAVTFRLPQHGLTGLSGANGAGKSTLLRLAATLDQPTEGKVVVAGLDAREEGAAARLRISYLGQDAGLYDALTVRENLAFVARCHGRAHDVDAIAAKLRVDAFLARASRTLSRGERQRVALARAWLAGDVLLLDEPTTGLDEAARGDLLAMLDEARSARTVLVATHDADLLAKCDRVLHLRDGRLEGSG